MTKQDRLHFLDWTKNKFAPTSARGLRFLSETKGLSTLRALYLYQEVRAEKEEREKELLSGISQTFLPEEEEEKKGDSIEGPHTPAPAPLSHDCPVFSLVQLPPPPPPLLGMPRIQKTCMDMGRRPTIKSYTSYLLK